MPTLAQRLQDEFTRRRRLTYRRDRIPGGLGDTAKASDFDKETLLRGLKVELEHTDDPAVALEIALDHLTEDSRYYEKLATLKLSRMLSEGFKRHRYAKFVESEHPRDADGKFTSTGGSSKSSEVKARTTTAASPSQDNDFSAIHRQYKPVNPDAPLTQEVYRDKEGQYTRERQKLHQKILGTMVKGVTPSKNPTVHMMGGGSAAGKGTIVRSGHLKIPDNSVKVDPDEVKGEIPEYQSMQFKDPRGAFYVHEESSDVAEMARNYAIENEMDLFDDGTGDGSIEKLEEKVSKLRRNGHRIVASYVTLDTDTAVKRAMERGARSGRYVPETVVRGIHANVSRVFPQAVERGLFDEFSLYDTRGDSPTLVASGQGKQMTIHRQDLYDQFLAKENDA